MLFWLSTCQIRMHCTRKHEQSEVLATSSEGKSPPLYYTVIKLLFCNRFCSFGVVGGGGVAFTVPNDHARPCAQLQPSGPCWTRTHRAWSDEAVRFTVWAVVHCRTPINLQLTPIVFCQEKWKKYLHNRTIFQKSHILVHKLPLHSHFSSVQCLHLRRAVHTYRDRWRLFVLRAAQHMPAQSLLKWFLNGNQCKSANTCTSSYSDTRILKRGVGGGGDGGGNLCITMTTIIQISASLAWAMDVAIVTRVCLIKYSPCDFFFFFFSHCNLFRLFTVGMTTGYWVVAFISMLIELTAIVC